MNLDVKTLAFCLLAIFIIQSFVFFAMTKIAGKYQGMKDWGYGSLMLALGFGAVYVRSFDFVNSIMILLSNIFLVAGIINIYTGTEKFMGLKRKKHPDMVLFFAYIGAIAYFTYIKNDVNMRIVLYSGFNVPLMIYNAYLLMHHSGPAYRKTGLFAGTAFLTLSLILILRAISTLTMNGVVDFFGHDSMQLFVLLMGIGMSMIWTLCFLIIINQRLTGEMSEQTQKMQGLLKERDRFFSVLAHDLKSPIASMLGVSELLSESSDDMKPERIRDMHVALHRSALTTNELLFNLLEWSGVQRGMKTFSPEECKCKALTDKVLEGLTMQAEEKNINLANNIPEHFTIQADLQMFQTIFRNLVSNAIKFTPENGDVWLNFHRMIDGRNIFSVSDNGIGMSKEMTDTLFDIGTNNRRAGTMGEPSTGFGLILCKEFVEKHGGEIWIESIVNEGTTISFTLS